MNAVYCGFFFSYHIFSINTASGSGQAAGTSDFTFHNVSINTDIDWGNKEVIIYFTFHNVSINTRSWKIHLGRL